MRALEKSTGIIWGFRTILSTRVVLRGGSADENVFPMFAACAWTGKDSLYRWGHGYYLVRLVRDLSCSC